MSFRGVGITTAISEGLFLDILNDIWYTVCFKASDGETLLHTVAHYDCKVTLAQVFRRITWFVIIHMGIKIVLILCRIIEDLAICLCAKKYPRFSTKVSMQLQARRQTFPKFSGRKS